MGSCCGNVEARGPHYARSILIHRAAVPVDAGCIIKNSECLPCLACIESVLHDTAIPLRFSRNVLVKGEVAVGHAGQIKEWSVQVTDHSTSVVRRTGGTRNCLVRLITDVSTAEFGV